MTGRGRSLLLTAVAVIASSCHAQDLEAHKQKYDDALHVIMVDHAQQVANIKEAYSAGLNTLKERVQAAGDLDKLKSVMEEISRFQVAKILPREDDNPIPEVLSIVKDRQAKTRRADTAKAQRIVTLASQYNRALLGLQKAHTRKGEIDKATAIQEERKVLAESETLTSANALLTKETKPSSRITPQPPRDPVLREPEIHIVPSDRSVQTDIATLRVGECVGNNRAYKFEQIPEELQGLNFVRMECRKLGDYDVRVQGRGLIYILVMMDTPTRGSELIKDGWKKTQHTIPIDVGGQLLVYEKQISNGNFKIRSTGAWAYMLAAEIPITMTASNN